MVTLTQEERAKFTAYLRQEIESDKGLIQQTEKIGLPDAMRGAITKKIKTEMMAKTIVANIFDSTEIMEM